MLFCERRDGKLCVLRKDQRIESYEFNGATIHFVRPAPYLVFALTDDWTVYGRAVDWGLEPILKKVRACDLWVRDLVSESIASMDRTKESRDRDVTNHIESYLSDNRREFARRTNDIRTANLNLNKKVGD